MRAMYPNARRVFASLTPETESLPTPAHPRSPYQWECIPDPHRLTRTTWSCDPARYSRDGGERPRRPLRVAPSTALISHSICTRPSGVPTRPVSFTTHAQGIFVTVRA